MVPREAANCLWIVFSAAGIIIISLTFLSSSSLELITESSMGSREERVMCFMNVRVWKDTWVTFLCLSSSTVVWYDVDTMWFPCSALNVKVVRNWKQARTNERRNNDSHNGSYVCSECQHSTTQPQRHAQPNHNNNTQHTNILRTYHTPRMNQWSSSSLLSRERGCWQDGERERKRFASLASLALVWRVLCCIVLCCVAVFLLRGVWEEGGVCIDHFPCARSKRFPCVHSICLRVNWHHAHMCLNMCAWCRFTRERFERTHVGFYSVSHHTPHTTATATVTHNTTPTNQTRTPTNQHTHTAPWVRSERWWPMLDKGKLSLVLVAILTCKSFVILGYRAKNESNHLTEDVQLHQVKANDPRESATCCARPTPKLQNGQDPVLSLVNPWCTWQLHMWRWIVLFIVFRRWIKLTVQRLNCHFSKNNWLLRATIQPYSPGYSKIVWEITNSEYPLKGRNNL